MNFKMRRLNLWLGLPFILCLVTAPIVLSHPDESGGGIRYSRGDHEREAGREEGSGATGQMAGWLFGLANFPVICSMLLKASARMLPLDSKAKANVGKINAQQKRYLMKLHYWLNPVAIAVAIVHFMASECSSTIFPELGLGGILLISILGLMMIFRWSPPPVRRAVFNLHTSPILLIISVSILLIGHSMVD